MASKMLGIQLQKGERVRLETPGGGGWGHSADRDVVSRTKDEALGFVKKPQISLAKVKL